MDKIIKANSCNQAPTWQFDIIRGIMCLFIFNCHFLAMFSFPRQPIIFRYVISFFSNAHLGVIYFFMLSGTVLAMSFARRKTKLSNIPTFLFKRFLRLLPPIFVSLLLAYCLMCGKFIFIDNLKQFFPLSDWAVGLYHFNPHELFPFRDVFNVFLLGHSGYNPNLWIVRFEFLVPVLVLLLCKIIHIKSVQISLLASLFLLMGGYLFMNEEKCLTLVFVLLFGLGLLIAYWGVNYDTKAHEIKLMSWSSFILWVLSTSFSISFNRLLDIILCALLLFVMYKREFVLLKKLKSIPVFEKLGRNSYEFFVYHLIIMASFSCWFFTLLYYSFGYYLSLLITWLFTVSIVYLLSSISNELTSKYYNPFLKKFL